MRERFSEQEERINKLAKRVEEQIKKLENTPVPQKRITSFMPHLAIIAAIVMILVILADKKD